MQQSPRSAPITRRPSAAVLPFLLKAQEQEQQKNFQAALNSYSQAIAADPKDPFAYGLRGIVNVGYFHNWERAIADLTKAIQYWDKFPRAYFYRGVCQLNIQNPRKAVEDFKKAVSIDANDMEVYLNWGRSHQFLIEFDKSEQILTEGLKRFPKNALLYQERGIIRFKMNRYAEALEDFTYTLAVDPNENLARNNRAFCYRAIGKFPEAIADLTYLIKNGQSKPSIFFNRACILIATGNNEQAIVDAERTLQIDPDYHAARLVMAEAYRNIGQFQRSLEEASAILKRNPQENAVFSNVLGVVNAADKIQYCIATDAYISRAKTRLLLRDTVGALADIDKSYVFERDNKKIDTSDIKSILTARQKYEQHQVFVPVERFPYSLQLFPRNAQDSAIVSVRGQIQRVDGQEYDSVYVELFKNNVIQRRYVLPLHYERGVATMSMELGLHAECSLYAFHIGVKSESHGGGNVSKQDTILLRRDSIVCGDALLISGQSNVVLGTLNPTPHNTYIRTFSSGVSDSYWGLAAANDNTDDYNIGATALRMSEEYVSEHHVPVAIIHGGLSGSVIELHLPQSDTSERLDNRTWYGHILRYAQMSGLQRSFRAALWYHGEANIAQDYFAKFSTLMYYWQQDYPSLRKVYAVQIRPARCGQVGQASLREQQRRFHEISSAITLHASAGVQGFDNCHFSHAGYSELGKQIACLINRDFFNAVDTIGIASPMIVTASWTGADRREMVLDFDTNDSLVISPDVQMQGTVQTLAQSAFLLDGNQVPALSVRVAHKRVYVTFAKSMTAKTISYIPEKFYTTAPDDVYSGPWLMTRRGVGALTFHNIPIQETR